MRTDLMSFFKKLKANMIINKKNEQTFYELAIREIATGAMLYAIISSIVQ